jgi:hypothetical protein
MNRLADVHFELLLEKRGGMPYEPEFEERAKLVAASRPRGERSPALRQMAVRLGDFLAEVRCQLESRFSAEPRATAC